VTLSKASIAAVAAAMKGDNDSADGDAPDDDNSESGDEQIPMKPPAKRQRIMNNRNNPALQRRNARKST
jgi:hypothetical protein